MKFVTQSGVTDAPVIFLESIISYLVNGNNKDTPVIPLQWKDEFADKQNTVNSLPEQETTCSVSTDWNKPYCTVTEDKSLNRVTTRNRKLPITRSNDFLW